MNEQVQVTGVVDTQDVPIITLNYGPDMEKQGAEISSKLTEEYETLRKLTKNPSVVVDIHADTAGSHVIRALYNLYKTVHASGGRLVCIGYPNDYLPSLSTLGLLDQPGFLIGDGREDAIARLRPQPAKS
jgi:hypothetical protein